MRSADTSAGRGGEAVRDRRDVPVRPFRTASADFRTPAFHNLRLMRDLLNGHAPPTPVLYVLRPPADAPAPVVEREYVGLTPDRTMTDAPLQCCPPQPESVVISDRDR